MTISDFSIHNVLRTYNKQFRIGKLVNGKGAVISRGKSDAVEISNESKRLAFIKELSSHITDRLGGKYPQGEVEKKVSQNFDKMVMDLATEISPENEEFIDALTNKLLEMF